MSTPARSASKLLLAACAAVACAALAGASWASAGVASPSDPAPLAAPAGLSGVRNYLDDVARTAIDLPPRRAATARRRSHAEIARLIPGMEPSLRGRVAKVILAEAELAGLDPLLVLALIHIESSFDPLAVSTAGAAGLMQLREATMRAEVERSKLPSSDPFDPVASVQAGVRYLRRLVAAFGDTDLALMAYNAGPNRIVGYLRQGEIPERFHTYPRKVRSHMQRLGRAGHPGPNATR